MAGTQPGQIPLVSVIVCTYNRAGYLKRCLDSIYSQDFKDYEIIVVNGPSTDNTMEVLAEYPQVRVISQEKLGGIAQARNLGVKASRGDIIAFFDDDAVAPEEWLGTLVDRLTTDVSICGVGGAVLTLGADSVQFKNGIIDIYGNSIPVLEEPQSHYNPDGRWFNNIIGMNSAFKKNAIEKIGGFDERFTYFYEESDLCVRLILSGCRAVHEPKAIIWHEFARSHNRKSTWDQNWYIISKMTVFFSLKNFGHRMGIYGRYVRPFLAYVKKLLSFVVPFLRREMSPGLLIKIYAGVTRGFMDGFMEGTREYRKKSI